MIILIMGVSGAGKTTIAKLLADSLHWEFQDADNFHTPENIEKMSQGIPLKDSDRIPWLEEIGKAIAQWLRENKNVVLACSALKASYRQYLVLDNNVKIVYLRGSYDTIQKRLQQRQNHFMMEKLLKSQFDTLEEPDNAICVDISQPPEVIVKTLKTTLGI
ncbi:gluconokinase [Anabaena sp. CA = ATCC 33047]|uniref:gluconokinase n=1 Tax=Anabaena sp. (strain CA / ATCC 33047) TaxID=52271 RepID=UPI00082A1BE0|nr:gluconokinase [Anabaena sp. CA = ATCC 33047]